MIIKVFGKLLTCQSPLHNNYYYNFTHATTTTTTTIIVIILKINYFDLRLQNKHYSGINPIIHTVLISYHHN